MKQTHKYLVSLVLFCSIFLLSQSTFAQERYEEYTGTILSFNGPRLRSDFFTLRIKNLTSDEQATNNRAMLRTKGQDKLMDLIRKEDLGTFSVGNQISTTINVVRETDVDGKKRIFVVFERRLNFAEIRGGYRSLDYPFGVIELLIDKTTAKGEGTFISMAQIRWNDDEITNKNEVEIENFGTYPAKMINVKGRIRGGSR
jgi:hypothetical protein